MPMADDRRLARWTRESIGGIAAVGGDAGQCELGLAGRMIARQGSIGGRHAAGIGEDLRGEGR